MVRIYNRDCMEAMQGMKDNEYDLAIVDPPYGINVTNMNLGNGKNKTYDSKKKWDSRAPSQKYFSELQRISKHQIIWGANHFISKIPIDSSCWIVWNKENGNTVFSDCELAWTSFKTTVRMFSYRWQGIIQGNTKIKEHKIHPTQKPVALYLWLLQKYAERGWRILDTHLGSGSIAIACHDLGFDLDGYELDKEYYDNAMKRFRLHSQQMKLF